jgi:ADP-ribose pyrophosphatase
MKNEIKSEVLSIEPLDLLEKSTISDVLLWIGSGVQLCRLEKPATPNKHLVSYFIVIDSDYLLLVDHINAEKWLPTGGHVNPGEHPKDTATREAYEELKIQADFIHEKPVFITSTETVGKTAGHIDVSLWYVLRGDRNSPIHIDRTEFNDAKWFHKDILPTNSDPNLGRFVQKVYG